MFLRTILRSVALWALATSSSIYAFAQTGDTARQTMEHINNTTITIVGGGIDSTSVRLAHDMGAVINPIGKQRVLPVLGLDDVQVVSDVLHLRGVDIGLVHEDALDAIRKNEVFPNVENRLQHIIRLSNDNVYIITRKTYDDISKLAGNTVNFGPGFSSPHSTPALLFQNLGVDVKTVNLSHAEAIEEIKNGKMAATVIVGSDLKSVTAGVGLEDGLGLLSIPLPANSEVYAPVTLTSDDFPTMIRPGTSVDTVSVSLIMVVNDWPSSHPRYEKVSLFVETLFSSFEEFHKPAHHPKWHEVNLAAAVSNSPQFQPAKQWLEEYEQLREDSIAKLQNSFGDFLENRKDKIELTRAERETMFEQFLSWPKNPVEAEFNIRLTNTKGVGEKLGTIMVRNTEIMVANRKEAALLIKPDLFGLKPGNYAFHVHENPECGAAEKDGNQSPGMAAGGHLWLAGTGSHEGRTFGSHLGDLPDLVADADGTATQEVVVARLSLADVVNRSVMLHASGDDAAPRMACGVIK